MYTLPSAPLRVRNIIQASWQLYQRSFRAVWYWAALLPVLSLYPDVKHILFGDPNFYHAPRTLNTEHIIFVTIILLLAGWLTSIVFYRIQQIAQGEIPSNTQAIRIANNHYLQVLIAMLIVSVVMGVGFALFVLPGVFCWILSLCYLPLILLDNKNSITSIIDSVKLVWRNWWETFFVMAVPALSLLICMLLVHYLIPIRFMWAHAIANVIFVTIFMPFINAALVVQFHDLKLREHLRKTVVTQKI